MKLQCVLSSFSFKTFSGWVVPECKRCGSSHIKKAGWFNRHQRYECKNCGLRFVYTSDLPRKRFHSSVIKYAVKLYASLGVSLRTIANKVLNFFGIRVSHESIRKRVKDFLFPEKKLEVGKVWHADETAIKIKGKVHWLWLVMDRKTRKIITWRLSNGRTYFDARIVMKEAKEKAGKPRVIVTDGLWEYRRAIRKTWGWRENWGCLWP